MRIKWNKKLRGKDEHFAVTQQISEPVNAHLLNSSKSLCGNQDLSEDGSFEFSFTPGMENPGSLTLFNWM